MCGREGGGAGGGERSELHLEESSVQRAGAWGPGQASTLPALVEKVALHLLPTCSRARDRPNRKGLFNNL